MKVAFHFDDEDGETQTHVVILPHPPMVGDKVVIDSQVGKFEGYVKPHGVQWNLTQASQSADVFLQQGTD